MIWPALIVIGMSIFGDVVGLLFRDNEGAIAQGVRLASLALGVFAIWCLMGSR